MIRWMALAIGLVLVVGCSGSRWAKNHPAYAEKYPHHTDNLKRMTRQAVDARHVAGDSGGYVSFDGQDHPLAASASIGAFHYPEKARGSLETYCGLRGLLSEGSQPANAGLEVGLRVQSPSRLAPFAGVGGYAGWMDGQDEEGPFFIEELSGEIGAIYPEVGVHFWATSKLRLTGSAKYYVTSKDNHSEFMLYGLTLSLLSHADREVYVPPVDCSTPVEECAPSFDPLPWPSEPWPDGAGPVEPTSYAEPLNAAYRRLPISE